MNEKENDNAAAARNELLQMVADNAEDNAAAAREAEKASRPPVVCLGKEGKENAYWARPDGSIHRLRANEHKGDFFLRMGRFEDFARWVAPGLPLEEAKEAEKRIWGEVKRRLFEGTLGKFFLPDSERHAGFWKISEGWLYCAGRDCYFRAYDAPAPVLVDNVQHGKVYWDKSNCPPPAADALTDAEGGLLLQLVQARTWTNAANGELMAGWLIAAMLAGVLPIRPHVWVNAPAGSGKSTLFTDLKAIAGDFCFSLAGGGSTSAGIRQSVANSSMPVILDEAEAGNNEKAQKNIAEWIEIMRLASYGQKMVMGGKDGQTAKAYSILNCFALASVNNTLERDADTSRCLKLEVMPYRSDEEKRLLWARQDAGRALVETPGFHGRLIARMLGVLPVLMENIRNLTASLRKIEGVDARRGELFSVLMACRYALTSSAPLTPEQMKRAADILRGYTEEAEEESDSARCLEVLLGYVLRVANGHGEMNVRSICQEIHRRKTETFVDSKDLEQALKNTGLTWREDKAALQVDSRAVRMVKIYAGTQWSNGKIAGVIAEGARRGAGKAGANAAGLWYENARIGGLTPVMCVFIPAALIL